MRYSNILTLTLFIFVGCANHEKISPSQNPGLNAVSPSTTATSEGGMMQRSLDSWLKEEWIPFTTPADKTVPASGSSTVQTPASQTVETASKPEDNTPFTLQKYADKWKVYQENKAKANEGKPKEPSHVEQMEVLPVIGK